MHENDPTTGPSPEEVERDLRQLALVDRILGLEAEVARLSIVIGESATPGAGRDRLQRELSDVYASRTWRVGRAVLAPARALRALRASVSKSRT